MFNVVHDAINCHQNLVDFHSFQPNLVTHKSTISPIIGSILKMNVWINCTISQNANFAEGNKKALIEQMLFGIQLLSCYNPIHHLCYFPLPVMGLLKTNQKESRHYYWSQALACPMVCTCSFSGFRHSTSKGSRKKTKEGHTSCFPIPMLYPNPVVIYWFS